MVSNTTKGVFAIIGCLFVDISVGEYNLLSFLYPYFGSYFHYKDRSITVDNTPIIGAVWLMSQIFSGLLGVVVNGYLGYRLTFLLFVLIFCAGQFAASYVTNFYAFIFCYAIPGGTAQGALMVLPLYCAWRYFPVNRKPLISGIILSAYALAPILSSFVSHRLINPENIDVVEVDGTKVFPQEVADRTPNFIRTFAGICLVLGSIGVLLIVEPNPEPYQQLVSDEYRSIRKLCSADNNISSSRDAHEQDPRNRPSEAGKPESNIKRVTLADVKDTLQDPIYWHLFFCIFFGLMFVHFVNFSFKKIGLNHMRKADEFLNFAGSIASICNGVSRLVSSLSFQRFGFLPVVFTVMLLQIGCSIWFIFSTEDRLAFTVCLSISFFTYGSQLGLYPLVADALYEKKGAMVYMMAFSGYCIGALIPGLAFKPLLSWLGEQTLFYCIAAVPPVTTYSLIVLHKTLAAAKLEKDMRAKIFE